MVDVSLDDVRPTPGVRCRRRPSGCLIQEMPNGYSKVIFFFFFFEENNKGKFKVEDCWSE